MVDHLQLWFTDPVQFVVCVQIALYWQTLRGVGTRWGEERWELNLCRFPLISLPPHLGNFIFSLLAKKLLCKHLTPDRPVGWEPWYEVSDIRARYGSYFPWNKSRQHPSTPGLHQKRPNTCHRHQTCKQDAVQEKGREGVFIPAHMQPLS